MTSSSLGDTVRALSDALAEYGEPSMLIGGIAVIARGVPRHTDDVDGTVAASNVDLDELVATLARFDIRPRIDDVTTFARQYQVLLLEHEPSGTEIELSLAWLPFEHEAIARAETIRLGGTLARIATAEDLVIYKAVAWRERDKGDIEQLIELHAPDIDFERVENVLSEFAEALEDPERLEAFRGLKERVLARIGDE